MNEQIKIRWYRTKVDKEVMSRLMKTSDFRGFCQVIPQLGLFVATTPLTYTAFVNIHADTWISAVPLLLAALFVHGTFSSFLGLASPVHELCHKTPFRTKMWNEFFLRIYAFLSWSDHIGFRPATSSIIRPLCIMTMLMVIFLKMNPREIRRTPSNSPKHPRCSSAQAGRFRVILGTL